MGGMGVEGGMTNCGVGGFGAGLGMLRSATKAWVYELRELSLGSVIESRSSCKRRHVVVG